MEFISVSICSDVKTKTIAPVVFVVFFSYTLDHINYELVVFCD